MTADDETPLTELLREHFGDVDFHVDLATLALYASFIFVGVGLGAIFTFALVTQLAGPEHVHGGAFAEERVVRIPLELIVSARDKVLIAAGTGFVLSNAYVLYTVLVRDAEEVPE